MFHCYFYIVDICWFDCELDTIFFTIFFIIYAFFICSVIIIHFNSTIFNSSDDYFCFASMKPMFYSYRIIFTFFQLNTISCSNLYFWDNFVTVKCIITKNFYICISNAWMNQSNSFFNYDVSIFIYFIIISYRVVTIEIFVSNCCFYSDCVVCDILISVFVFFFAKSVFNLHVISTQSKYLWSRCYCVLGSYS